MRYSFQTQQWLPYPLELVFGFFANPENLPLLLPEWQNAHIDTAAIVPPPHPASGINSSPKIAGSGSRIALSFRPFPNSPFRAHWVAEISEFVWNEHFCDRQISGPFAYWSHCHYLRHATESGVDGTSIADDLEYELPFGVGGRIAHKLFLRHQIEQIFLFRQRQLARILAQITRPPQPPPIQPASSEQSSFR